MQALLLPWEGVTWGQAGVLSAALGHKPGSLKCTHQGLPKAFPKLGPYILNPTITYPSNIVLICSSSFV